MTTRNWIAGLGTALLMCSIAPGQGGPDGEVSRLVSRFMAAEQSFDSSALSKLISERYVEVSPAGEVDAHDRFLGFYTAEKKVESPPITVSEEQVRVFGETAVEIVKISFAMTGPDGAVHMREIRGSFVAQREGGVWKLIGAQYTGIRAAPVAASPASKP